MPAASPPPKQSPQGPPAFAGLLDEAELLRHAPERLLLSGELAPERLCLYAAGKLPADERAELQSLLLRSPWALRRVTALVKAGRSEEPAAPLAHELRVAAEKGGVDPYRALALALLSELPEATAGHEALEDRDPEAIRSLPHPRAQAACWIALRKLKEARGALGALTSLSSLEQLAQRVLILEGEEAEAGVLVELLSALT